MWTAEPRLRFAFRWSSPSVRSVAHFAALLEFPVRGHRLGRVVPEKKVAKRYFISGMVQGVGYRFFAIRSARRLGVTGYVQNLRDGRVEVYAIGPDPALASLRRELERGPSGAVVEDVSEEEAALDHQFAKDFSIEHEGW
jgi:acylphosphatase